MRSGKEIPPDAIAALNAKMEAERQRQALFGDVRPIISTVDHDYRLVAVGHTIHWDKKSKWRTFTDFLLSYIQHLLSVEWGAAERKKPIENQHIVLQWYHAFSQMQQRSPAADATGLRSGVPDGPSFAYLLLAYDLYLLGDHGALRDRFVRRLKEPAEFQGARYELFVAATLIRAGFDLAPEDERDGSRQHAEYFATNRRTGEMFSVEAKSRRLPGVLGFPGETASEKDFHLDVRQLIKRALEKKVEHPYIVFIDANMPPRYATERRAEWVENVNQAMLKADSMFNDVGVRAGSLYNFLAVTNVPDHYGEAGGPLPEPVVYRLIPAEARRLVKRPEVFLDIERGLSQSHRVPTEFSNE